MGSPPSPIVSSPNSVGVKSEIVETLSVGEDTVEIRVSIGMSSGDENLMPRNTERDAVPCMAEESPSISTCEAGRS